MKHIEANSTVDARGVLCPEPVLRARAGLEALAPGEVMELLATDPHAELDIEVFCASTGHQLLSAIRREDTWHFLVAKRGDDKPGR